MKKSFLCILLLIIIIFSSCGKIEIVELNERLIIEAIGIDYEDGLYKVTIEGLDSLTSGNDSDSISSGRLTKCYMFRGETIGMAMNSISEITGQIPLFSQARVLVIGFETAKQRLGMVLDFFRREYTTRTDILVAVAENTAKETVSADFGENVSAGNIFEAALSSYRYTGRCTYSPLYRFLNSLTSETNSACCPLIGIKNNDFSDKKEAELKGTVIFKKDKEVLKITPEQTLGLMLITDNIKNGDITVKTEEGICTFEIIESKTKTKINTKEGKTVITTDISLRCDIPEFQSEDFSGLSKSDTEKTAYTAAKKIALLTAELIDEIYYKENCDIFNFGKLLALEDHDAYKEYISRYPESTKNVTHEINTKVSVRRIGKVILEEE